MFPLRLRAVSLLLLLSTARAWVSSSQQPRGRRVTGARAHRSSAVTRWDADLDRARDAHRKKQWTEVQQWCTRVIEIADDWNAIEQAHLRLALAEQKRAGADGGRRAFQHGIEHCPSSDTLMLAWALMESKLKNVRSQKIAKALLRRAVALNPKKNSPVLRWAVFEDLEAAGGAAVQAVRSALAPSPPRPQPALRPLSRPSPSSSSQAPTPTSAMGLEVGAGSSSTSFSRRTTRAEEMEERVFATELLELCRSNQALQGEEERQQVPAPAAAPAPATVQASAAPSARFEELAGELERRGGGAEGRGRELCGSWKLVFTTCTECDRLLTRTGSEVFQRLTPPIREIKSDPSHKKHAAPFRLEVTLRPSSIPSSRRRPSPRACSAAAAATTTAAEGSVDRDAAGLCAASAACGEEKAAAGTAKAPKAGVAYFFSGWADHAPAATSGERGSLMQHVAPRTAAVFSGDDDDGSSGGGCGAARRAPRVPSPTPPPAVFRALGRVARSGKGLEKLATQKVTYVGRQMRIGRSSDGNVYVYERCAWPAGEIDEGLMV